MATKEGLRVCEECGRDEATVRRQDEPPAVIKLRRYGQNVLMLCDRCHNEAH